MLKITLDPALRQFLTLGPDPGLKEKRRILLESTLTLLGDHQTTL